MPENEIDPKSQWKKRLAIWGGATLALGLTIGSSLCLDTIRVQLHQTWTSTPFYHHMLVRQQRADVLRILAETPLTVKEASEIAETILAESRSHTSLRPPSGFKKTKHLQ
jgi:hypothetical protein